MSDEKLTRDQVEQIMGMRLAPGYDVVDGVVTFEGKPVDQDGDGILIGAPTPINVPTRMNRPGQVPYRDMIRPAPPVRTIAPVDPFTIPADHPDRVEPRGPLQSVPTNPHPRKVVRLGGILTECTDLPEPKQPGESGPDIRIV